MQKIKFKDAFFAPPLVVVSPKLSYNNKNPRMSGSRCNAVTAWVEVSSILYFTKCRDFNPNRHLLVNKEKEKNIEEMKTSFQI